MINQSLHGQPVALDSALHRQLKLRVPVTDWSVANRLNSIFVAAAEFGDICREFPIVFVRAGKQADGTDQIAPIAVLGLTQNQNLYLDGGQWRARSMPAVLRHYPFCIARIDEKRFAICVDMAWSGVGNETGTPVFEADGQPAALLKTVQPQMETLETEIQRTRLLGKRLLELGLLRDMRFDATLPDGRKHSVDGFLTVDDKKMSELPDAVIAELHRNGVLGLVNLHWTSLGNIHRLVEWHAERLPALGEQPAAAAAGAGAPANAAA